MPSEALQALDEKKCFLHKRLDSLVMHTIMELVPVQSLRACSRMFVPKPQVLSFALIKDFRRFAAIPCRNGQCSDGRPKRNTLLGDFERDDEPEPDGAVCQICGLGTLIDRLERVNV